MTMFLTKKNNDSVVIKCVLELFLHGLKKRQKRKCLSLKKQKIKVSEPRFDVGTFSV